MEEPIFVICPHCQDWVEIVAINCAIFRHGVFKASGLQMPPHANEEECTGWVREGLIWGCGKPFQVVVKNNKMIAIICAYI